MSRLYEQSRIAFQIYPTPSSGGNLGKAKFFKRGKAEAGRQT
jgi:hypothetical protein